MWHHMVPASGRHRQCLPYILLSTVITIMKKLQQTLIAVPAGYCENSETLERAGRASLISLGVSSLCWQQMRGVWMAVSAVSSIPVLLSQRPAPARTGQHWSARRDEVGRSLFRSSCRVL